MSPRVEFIDYWALIASMGRSVAFRGIRARLTECRRKEAPYSGSVGGFLD